MDPRSTLARFFLAACLAILLPLASQANDASRTDTTLDLISSSTTLTAGASTTLSAADVGQSEIQGMDWDASSAATFTLSMTLKYSNSPTGPFSTWTSETGTDHTSSFTTPSAALSSGTYYLRGGTDLRLFPARYVQITITNDGAATVTLSRVTMFTY